MDSVGNLSFESYTVSTLSLQRAEEIASVINRANYAFPRIFPGDRISVEGLFKSYGASTLYLARIGSQAVATFALESQEECLRVYVLAVVPEAQGKRLGEAMLAEADRIAVRLGRHFLELEAIDTGGLIAYYVRIGFHEVSRETKPIGHWRSSVPFDLVTLRRACTVTAPQVSSVSAN
jgi:GNAT superfamily N-acetyltransferase